MNEHVPDFEALAGRSEHRIQIGCGDLGASNEKFENADRILHRDWRRLYSCCRIHRYQTAKGSVFSLIDHDITAVVNFALVLRHGGTLEQLREATRVLLLKRLRLDAP